jgi:hypothetical protein
MALDGKVAVADKATVQQKEMAATNGGHFHRCDAMA